MAESFAEKRRKELGVSGSTGTMTFAEKRRMDLGLIPDKRPKEASFADKVSLGKVAAPPVSMSKSPIIRASEPFKPEPSNSDERSIMERTADAIKGGLNNIFKADPVARVLNYPFAKAAQLSVPDAPIIMNGQNVPGTSAREDFAQRNPVLSTGNKTLDKIGNVVAYPLSLAVNPAQTEQNLITGGYGVAERLLGTKVGQAAEGALGRFGANVTNKVNPLLNTRGVNLSTNIASKAAQQFGRGAAANAVTGFNYGLQTTDGSASKVGKETIIGAALGGAGDAGLGALGSAFRNSKVGQAFTDFLSRGKSIAEPQTSPLLALPEPRPRGNINRAQTPEVVYGEGDIYRPEPIGLPEPQIAPPTRARLETKVNPYEQKLIRLFEAAKQENLPPGREREALEDLWSRMADREDPSLDKLIDLAYPSGPPRREVNPDTLRQTRERQGARDVAGVPSPVRSLDERYTNGVNAPAASPIERVGRSTSVKPQPIELRPISTKTEPEVLRSVQEKSDIPPAADDHIVEEFTTRRVRDKLSSYADELINSAKNDLKGTKLSSNPLDTYAKFGAGYILKGTVKLADFTEVMIKEFGEGVRPMIREIWSKSKEQYQSIKAGIERTDVGLDGIDLTQLKDHSGFKYNSTDVYRNFRDVFGESFPKVKEAVLDPFDEAKAANVKQQHDYLEDMYANVVQKLGVKKGSKLSALVQDFGEGKISLEALKAKTPDWEKVVAADKWFRRAYDTLLDEVNGTRAIIYPNNPEKIVPKRSDYYRHFQELDGLEGLKNIFETPSNIDPKLEGISEFLSPKSKFAGFMQKRGLGPYKKDAVGGFLNYLPSASYAIHIDPHINTFKTLAKVLAEDTGESKNLNKFINFLNRYSQDLAGKTNVLDRAFVEYVPGGRTTMAAMNWLNNRIKANVILGNVGSTVAQIANIPQGIAFAKQYAVPGAGKTLQSIFKPNEEIKQSGFIKERFADHMYRKFDTNWLSVSNPLHLRKMAEWMLETGDRMGSEFIWNSVYYKGVKEGVKDPVKYADNETRRLVGGRGIGEVPIMQKSKLVQMIMPFTLEVANLWRVQRDFIKAKDFVGIAMLFVGNYALNKVAEQVRGSGVTFDPIQATVEASAADLSVPQRVGRLGGEVLSNLPLGQTLAKAYPEYGKEVFGYELPTRKKLFGDNDPTRFGGGLLAVKGIQEPITYLAPSFGGNQVKKTVKGVQTLLKGGETTGDGELKYPIDRSPGDLIKAPLFGPGATNEARDYYNNERRPLSEKQTEAYKQEPNPREFYKQVMQNRKLDTYQRRVSEIAKDPKMSDGEKEKAIDKVLSQYSKDFPESPLGRSSQK